MVWTLTNLRTSVNLSSEATAVKLAQRAYAETSRLSCLISDEAGTLSLLNEDELVLMDGALKAFQGPVRVKTRSDRGVSTQRTWAVELQDYTSFLGDDIVPSGTVRSTVETDKARIAWLGSTFGTRGLVFSGATIVQLRASMPEQDFSRLTLHQAMTLICSVTGGSFYVDYDKVLHYHSSEVLSAPFGVSDNPNGTTTFGFDGLSLTDDTTAFCNEVLVVYEGGETTRYLGGSPPAAGTRRAAILEDTSITTLADAQAAGDLFIAKYGVARQPSQFRTYRPGLRAGMTIQITHAGYGLVAATYRISAVEAEPVDMDRIAYTVYIGSSPISLSTLLRQADQTTAGLQAAVAAAPDAAVAAVSDLSAGGGNLVPNSSFEDQTSWTVPANGAIGVDPVSPQEAFAGSKVYRWTPTAADGFLFTPFLPVARGSFYWASAWIFARAVTLNGIQMYVHEFDAAGVSLQTTVVGQVTAVSTEWQRLARKFGPAAGVGVTAWHANTAKIRLVFSGAGAAVATGTFDVDGVQLERGDLLTAYAAAPYELVEGSVGTTQIADDAVTSPKLIANAVTAGKVAAGVITAVELAANAVTADKIAAGAVLITHMGSEPRNLVPNPGAEGAIGASGTTNLPGWSSGVSAGWSVRKDGTLMRAGHAVFQFVAPSASNASWFSLFVPVSGSRRYAFSYWYSGFAGNTTIAIQPLVVWYDKDQVAISTVQVDFVTVGASATFNQRRNTLVAPVNAVWARFGLQAVNVVTGQRLYVDDIEMVLADQNVDHADGKVTITGDGIDIYQGAIRIRDRFDSTTLEAVGFAGSWMTFLKKGFYNADFDDGSTSDIPVSLVGSASTLADYDASLTANLPYWVVQTSTCILKKVADAQATEGFCLEATSASGTTDFIILQDVPIQPGRHYTVRANVKSTQAVPLGYALSWRDANHAVIGTLHSSSDGHAHQSFQAIALGEGVSDSAYNPLYVSTEDYADGSLANSLPAAPANAKYLRVALVGSVTTGGDRVRISDITLMDGNLKIMPYPLTLVNAGTFNGTLLGHWRRLPLGVIEVWANITASGTAGSGATAVSFSVPVQPHRDFRQIMPVHVVNTFGNPILGAGVAATLVSGTTSHFERIRVPRNNALNRDEDLIGSDLLLGSEVVIHGTYIERLNELP